MAAHEFGIMDAPPEKGVRYDAYEPQRYHCIAVNDDDLEDIAAAFDGIDFFWHTRDVPAKGLAYTGITLIPPSSMPTLMAVIAHIPALSELYSLLRTAHRDQKWVIHFGL